MPVLTTGRLPQKLLTVDVKTRKEISKRKKKIVKNTALKGQTEKTKTKVLHNQD